MLQRVVRIHAFRKRYPTLFFGRLNLEAEDEEGVSLIPKWTTPPVN